MPTQNRVSIYLGPELRAYLREDPAQGRSAQINTLADRYAYILAGVRLDLAEAEMNLIRDANRGTVFAPAQIGLPGVVHNVEDAIRLDQADQKWGVDGPALVEKLRGLTRAELAWLVEDVERL